MKKFDYSFYNALDLALDDYFRRWVLNPDQESEDFWREWTALHPDRQTILEEARQIILNLRFKEDRMPAESLDRIKQHLDAVYDRREQQAVLSGEPYNAGNSIRLAGSRWNGWYRAAAVFAGLLVCGVVLWMTVYRNRAMQIVTGFGESQLVNLPDGSTVKLNANSSLQYQSDWENARIREVWLQGEAFFKVVKKNDHGKIPFVVHTGKLNVRVLGTEFNVSNRHEQTTVVLNSGSVKLETDAARQSDVLMEPGDLVQFSEKDQSFTKKTVNPEKFSSWTHNLLYFDNTSLKEVAQVLEDTYGLRVKFQHAGLASRKFTATLPISKPEILLTAISESLNIRVIRKDNEVMLQHNP